MKVVKFYSPGPGEQEHPTKPPETPDQSNGDPQDTPEEEQEPDQPAEDEEYKPPIPAEGGEDNG